MRLLFRYLIILVWACASVNAAALQAPSFSSKPKLDHQDNFQALMESVGKLAIFIRINQAVYEKCNIQANLTKQEAKADFLSRKKLAFQFNDLLADSNLEPKDVMGDEFTELVDEFCASNNSSIEVDMKIRPLVNAQLEVMEKLDRSLLLSRQQDKTYSKEHMQSELAHKIENTNILPLDEKREIASAMYSGVYVYAGVNYIENNEDLSTAINIQEAVYKETLSNSDAFILGKVKLANGDKSSLDLIIGAASEQMVSAQEWLGNYYACNSNKAKGTYWLEKADKNGSETAIDSILEIRDLGRPTVCSYLL
ncbi:hypothetical protein KJ365_00235 [Glaciecola sp. XM2]|jgi:hypothetical protein|uniref:hypothetical protein n=1 Tax=Glaciecola sp. XM2 TaxID=1914931 RepID=UPI001BDDDEDE|nr:hypothetical protein [Glaciecola sp. XM2]MBT1449292.1 hypothetical protein [Glaciecola sp. XM2]